MAQPKDWAFLYGALSLTADAIHGESVMIGLSTGEE
jgi:hypothetical protein